MDKQVTCPCCKELKATQTGPNRIWCEGCGWVNAKGEYLDK